MCQGSTKCAVLLPFLLRCKQPVRLRATENQALKAESLLHLLALPCLVLQARAGRKVAGLVVPMEITRQHGFFVFLSILRMSQEVSKC